MPIQINLFTGRRLKMVDSILVSVDFSNKNDTGVMVVGRKTDESVCRDYQCFPRR